MIHPIHLRVGERDPVSRPLSAHCIDAYASLGEAYARSGQKQHAVDSYKKSLALAPDSANTKEAIRKLAEQK
jgi:hypothetical protein